MLKKTKYVPILKCKDNEIKAIGNVAASIRYNIKPLVEITPLNQKNKRVDDHIAKFVDLLSKHARSGDLFVDFYGLLPEENVASGENATVAGFKLLNSQRIEVTPVYGFERNDEIWPDLQKIVSAFGKGFCFRISIDDLDDQAENTWRQIVERSAQLHLLPSDIDIVLDLRYVGENPETGESVSRLVSDLKELVIDFLSYNPRAAEYRSITVCGASALKTVSRIPKDEVGEVTRVELHLWSSLYHELGEFTILGFGDYGVIHPDFTDPGKIDNVSAKIRYTAGSKIIYFRGHGLLKPIKDFDQYRALSKKISLDNRYRGRYSSYGDDLIYKCANGLGGTGNLGTWVLADMNHHITYTANQVQRLLRIFTEPSLTESEKEQALEIV
jgi:hypothetical protein